MCLHSHVTGGTVKECDGQMTITDLRCDHCECGLPLPPELAVSGGGQASVRFSYHPGNPHLRDNSGLLCLACWDELATGWDDPAVVDRCAKCGTGASRFTSLHLRASARSGEVQLCGRDAVEFLNALRTVDPKLDPETFRFPGDQPPP